MKQQTFNLDQPKLLITGMTCDGCAAHVRRALKEVEEVESVVAPGWQEGRAGRNDICMSHKPVAQYTQI